MNQKYSIITAYYNNENLTKEFLDNLVDKKADAEVIVVNAGSVPIEHVALDKRIDLPENQSFSNSMNAGIKEACGDYIIVIGNDGFPQSSSWLKELEETQKETGAFIVSPEPTNPTLSSYRRFVLKETERVGYYDMFPAICWFMPRKTIDEIGLFDERFLVGCYEDNDYCKRVRLKGGDIVVRKGLMLKHLLSQTIGTYFDVRSHMAQNRLRFDEKWKQKQ